MATALLLALAALQSVAIGRAEETPDDGLFSLDAFSARVDWFETSDRSFEVLDNNSEEGWAGTLAFRAPACDWATVVAEAFYIDSDRPARVDQGLDPRQQQVLLQLALQVEFK